jgi:hypothetical protein
MADYTDVYARVPFKYDRLYRDRGEHFKLIGARNDAKLIGMKYVLPYVSSEMKNIKCDKCPRHFIAEGFYEQHKRKKDCNDDQGEPTRLETAELIGADPDKFVMENDDAVQQKVKDLSGAV